MAEPAHTPPDLVTRVEAVLEAVRPSIQLDGGDLELVEVTADGEVRVRLLGACVDCPSAHLTLKVGIERNLMARIPEVTGVTAVDSS